MALCQEYGIDLSEDDIKAVEELADADGEVLCSSVSIHKKSVGA